METKFENKSRSIKTNRKKNDEKLDEISHKDDKNREKI